MNFQKFIFSAIFLTVISVNVFSQESIENELLTEINNLRKNGCQCGEQKMPPAGPLTWSKQLEKAAERHARDMFDNQHFDHIGTDKSDLGDRITAEGYDWSLVGENIAWGHTSVKDAVEGWVLSPEHCKNMMDPTFTDVGAAVKGTYWVLDLGKQW